MSIHYRPLDYDQDSIRLLRILQGERNNPISCELFHSYRDEERGIAYKALSYTWGNGPRPTGRLHVDGSECHISENLLSALEHIRLPKEDVILWVDALCIDQQNPQEKGHQVKQMGDIYAGADEVLIWLGDSNEDIAQLMLMINWVHESATKAQAMPGADDWLSLCRQFVYEFWDEPPISSRLRTFAQHRRGFVELLQRPWFNRVWILQEAAKAKTAKIMCGPFSCPARTFALMPKLMGVEVDGHIQAVLDIMPRIRTNTWWNSTRSLHSLLTKFSGSDATVTRDNIYALLGMSEDASDPEKFYPDYEKSDSQVFRDTACFCLFGEILDSTYLFPEFTLAELRLPVEEMAKKTLIWTIWQASQPGKVKERARKTAELLALRLNEEQLEAMVILSSLVKEHKKVELQFLFVRGDINITPWFDGCGLLVQSMVRPQESLHITFCNPETASFRQERISSRLRMYEMGGFSQELDALEWFDFPEEVSLRNGSILWKWYSFNKWLSSGEWSGLGERSSLERRFSLREWPSLRLWSSLQERLIIKERSSSKEWSGLQGRPDPPGQSRLQKMSRSRISGIIVRLWRFIYLARIVRLTRMAQLRRMAQFTGSAQGDGLAQVAKPAQDNRTDPLQKLRSPSKADEDTYEWISGLTSMDESKEKLRQAYGHARDIGGIIQGIVADVDVDTTGDDQFSALCLAAFRGDVGAEEALLEVYGVHWWHYLVRWYYSW